MLRGPTGMATTAKSASPAGSALPTDEIAELWDRSEDTSASTPLPQSPTIILQLNGNPAPSMSTIGVPASCREHIGAVSPRHLVPCPATFALLRDAPTKIPQLVGV